MIWALVVVIFIKSADFYDLAGDFYDLASDFYKNRGFYKNQYLLPSLLNMRSRLFPGLPSGDSVVSRLCDDPRLSWAVVSPSLPRVGDIDVDLKK